MSKNQKYLLIGVAIVGVVLYLNHSKKEKATAGAAPAPPDAATTNFAGNERMFSRIIA